MAQERLRGVEEGLLEEAKIQHQRRAALEHQAAQREAELVAQELRIQQDREELDRAHSNRLRELHEREIKLQQEKEKMVRESKRQTELKAARESQVRRVQDARNAVGLERAEMKLSKEDLDERIRVATEEAYRRGKAGGVRTAQRTVEMERMSSRGNTRSRITTDPGPQPLAESTLKETKVPLAKNCKLNLRYFNGAELYKGLGAGFKPWSVNIKQQVDLAERACGHRWPEEVKISVLGSYLRGNAENYFDGMKDQWWECKPTVQYALEEMEQAFNRTFTSAQINELMMKPKAPSTTWYEHLLYLMAVANATHAPLSHVPEHLVFHADEEMAKTLSTLYDKDAKSPIRHANELAVFAQNFEDNMKKRNNPGKLAAAVQNETENREDTRSCQVCHKGVHTAKVCTSKGSKGSEHSGNCKNDGDQNNPRWGFSGLLAGEVTCEDWILDSGASTHLVRNADVLED